MKGLPNPVVTRAAEDYRTRTGSMALSAPFCPLANLLSPDQSGRWLVGAVGVEPNAQKNFVRVRAHETTKESNKLSRNRQF